MDANLISLVGEQYCYLTTIGRKTGKSHEIEIWFCIYNNSIYLMSGSGKNSDWIKNLLKDSNATIRIGESFFQVKAIFSISRGGEQSIRHIMADKYGQYESDGSQNEWAMTSMIVRFDLDILETALEIKKPPSLINYSFIVYILILAVSFLINLPITSSIFKKTGDSLILIGLFVFLISIGTVLRWGTSTISIKNEFGNNSAAYKEWGKNRNRNEITFLSAMIGSFLSVITGYIIIFFV